MNAPMPTLRTFHGEAIAAHLPDLARLRITVFRDWPYLYDGDAGYEAGYLQTYPRSWRSIAVLAFDGDRVVGASTGLPLADESATLRAPFEAAGLDVERVFYCGESVLLSAYRGRGLGHRFFEEREAHARALGGFEWTAFCAVERPGDDPRRPAFHRGNEAFWHKRGYRPRPGLQVSLRWREVGGDEGLDEQPQTLGGWLRPLERNR